MITTLPKGMKIISLLIACSILLSGCVRKSDLDEARENLAEAQRKIDMLENERVSKSKYEAAQASLRLADVRIAELEFDLKKTEEQLVVLTTTQLANETIGRNGSTPTDRPTSLGLTKGTYETANETHVYSADAELNFGQHLKISSPSGLMVTDPDHKVVGGDLSIKSKDMVMDAPDGILTTAADGTVQFIGKTLTMKFADGGKPQDETPSVTSPPNQSPTGSNEVNPPAGRVPPSAAP